MSDIALRHRIHVAVDQQTAWNVVADYAQDVRWRSGVTSMVADPAGCAVAGTRTVETLRLAGRTWHILAVVTSVAPLARLEWETTHGADVRGARTVEPTSSGCVITIEHTVRPSGLAQRLARPYLARLLHRNLRGDLLRLRELLETSPTATPVLVAAGAAHRSAS